MKEILSREYGWLPSDIDKQDYGTLLNYLEIIKARRVLEEKEVSKIKKR
jgi:hypothetical protein